jgi:hypothetical protein
MVHIIIFVVVDVVSSQSTVQSDGTSCSSTPENGFVLYAFAFT